MTFVLWVNSPFHVLPQYSHLDLCLGSNSATAKHPHCCLATYVCSFGCMIVLSALLENKSSQSSLADSIKFSSRISLHVAAAILPSTLASPPATAAGKHPYSMMLPWPCFTVRTVCRGLFRPNIPSSPTVKSSIFGLWTTEPSSSGVQSLPHAFWQTSQNWMSLSQQWLFSLPHALTEAVVCTVSPTSATEALRSQVSWWSNSLPFLHGHTVFEDSML